MREIKSCSKAEADYIHQRLQEYNSRYITEYEELSYCIKNEEELCIAGIIASRDLDCVTVDYLFVDEKYRGKGYGSKLLAYLERQALQGAAKRIVLNTFGFQAPAFYKKHGYQLFAKVEPCLNTYGQYYFKKELL